MRRLPAAAAAPPDLARRHVSRAGVVALGLAALCARRAQAAASFGVVLLQPSSLLEQRVAGVDALADYIRAVEVAVREVVHANPSARPAAGFIVVAVRPGRHSKAWLDFDTPPAFDISRQLVARIGAVPPLDAHGGPVVFALKVALWGGFESARIAPAPAEWKAATHAAGHALEVDALIDRIWP
ncbi:MAG: hypothetical protein HS128_22575 [Ideonella sp.]|nr:hypothetical protein [Ideonella sp.]MCC7458417.1 hypothetical protein [Nitrospira sp.]